jgi:putative inorganic carbon (HCO3(-)) transporter
MRWRRAFADPVSGRVPASAPGATLARGRVLAQNLADAEPWLVIPFLLLGLMLPAGLSAALGVAVGFWLIRWIAWRRATVRTAGDLPIALLALLLPVTLWVTPLPQVTRQQVLWLLTGIAFYYVIVNWVTTRERERLLVLCLVAAGVLAALLAPVAVAWVTAIKLTIIPEALYRRLPLLTSNPLHPNVLAGALVLGLPVPLALLIFAGQRLQRYERIAATVAVAGMAIVLVLTKSRGAWLAAAVAAAVLLVLRWRRSLLVLGVAGVLAAFVLAGIGWPTVAAKLNASGMDVGVPGRLEIWSRGLYLVQDFPFTGIGMGAFEQVTNALYPYFLIGPNADAPHAHNIFLQVAVDLGLPGLLAWLGLLCMVVLSAWRVHRTGRRGADMWTAGLGAGLLGSQVALAVHGLFDAAVWGAHSGIVVWVIWGLTMAAHNLRRAEGE